MNKISASWLSEPGAQKICKMLSNAGFMAYFVGGCVRNEILGVPVSDIDLATDARPQNVVKLAEDTGLKAIPTGIEHGTITIIAHGQPYEVTTFRKDMETDGRHAVVHFSDSILEDASRRDFTMNALYADSLGNIFDPLNGMPDLTVGLVRFIENPVKRIQEDYLRVLRFFRFYAWYGTQTAGIDPDGLAAIADNLDGLDTLSGERVGSELLKILTAFDPASAVASMKHSGVLARILPGATSDTLPVLIHLEQQIGIAPNALRRLASLGLGLDVKERLRLSRKQAKYLMVLTQETNETKNPAELAYRYSAAIGLDIILLRSVYLGMDLPENLMENLQLGETVKFPIQAPDLMPTYSGAALGEKMRDLEAKWIASGFETSREELLP